MFHDISTVTTASAATVTEAVYWSGVAWVNAAGTNRSYGPVNLRYTTGSGSDGSPPTVAVTLPAAGATVSGMMTLAANASDNVAVAGVTFSVGGVPAGPEDTSAPYQSSFDTRTLANGSYSVTAVARDTSGLTTTSAPVAITVSNAGILRKTMPVGDSITYGFVSDGDANNENGGYRRFLWETLTTNGYSNVDLVGSIETGPATIDRNHEGHPGYRTVDFTDANRITGWLAAAQPAIILLMIGTNDLDTGADAATALTNLSGLIDRILADAPSARLIVSSIIPVRTGSSHTTITPAKINSYNAGIPSMISARQAQGKNLSFVNMHSLAGLDTSISSPDYGADGLHPSPAGYAKMAAVWYTALQPLL
jgi:lysophospholipase L1-like esterase